MTEESDEGAAAEESWSVARLVQELAEASGADLVAATEFVSPDGGERRAGGGLRTVAAMLDGEELGELVLPLEVPPCGEVYRSGQLVCGELGPRAYAAVPMLGEAGIRW